MQYYAQLKIDFVYNTYFENEIYYTNTSFVM